jgi:hypothetical protein
MQIIRAGDPRFAPRWETLRAQARPRSALYTPLDLEYQSHYPQTWKANDQSFLIEDAGVPLAGAVLALKPLDNHFELSGFGRPIWYLEKPDLAPYMPGSVLGFVKEEMERVRAASSIKVIKYQNPEGALTPMGKYLLDSGAKGVPAFSQVVSLDWDEAGLRQMIRSRYKSLINWGLKNLNPTIVDHANLTEEEFTAYRRLHFTAAGRETRSTATWRVNAEMIQARQAFLVLGRLDGTLVTGAFFNVFGDACYYSNAASDRALFEKPLGHCIMWRGLLHAKALGCREAELGQILFANQPLAVPAHLQEEAYADEKNLNIANFKRGFGGRTQCRLDIVWSEAQPR